MIRNLVQVVRSLIVAPAPQPLFVETPGPLISAPIPPSWILDGGPQARARVLSTSGDGIVESGIWECTAGQFDWEFAFDETVQILEGEVHVTYREHTAILAAGASAFFPFGAKTRWSVPKYVRKFFSHRYPGRVARWVKRIQDLSRAVTLLFSGLLLLTSDLAPELVG
jgi:uncharacterized cupin superfamily protein